MNAQKILGMLLVGKEAMQTRKEMLISLGANYRASGQSELVSYREENKAQNGKRPVGKPKTE
jgi:hypothetical protein